MRLMKAFLLLAVALLFTGCCAMQGGKMCHRQHTAACKCGENCKCPGPECACMKTAGGVEGMHVLKIEGDEALVCPCGAGCKACKLDPGNPTKCGCGMELKRVSIKGMYRCACGPACSCNTVSDKPGTCHCGKALEKVE
ncbi:MAG: hypothetical protein AB1568_14555 [Thermodesulfobacteriota bacterium]